MYSMHPEVRHQELPHKITRTVGRCRRESALLQLGLKLRRCGQYVTHHQCGVVGDQRSAADPVVNDPGQVQIVRRKDTLVIGDHPYAAAAHAHRVW